jgi:probable rRNA maturation factor
MLAPAELESDLGRTMVPVFLGDLALAHGTIVREAEAAGLALEAHVAHLMVHGVLHLLGHDHVADSEAEEMEALERVILAGLGIADPYARHGRGKAPAVAEA